MRDKVLSGAALATFGPVAVERARPVHAMGEAEFEAFYAKTARPLWAYVCRVSGDAALADDVLQEAFCRFLRIPLPEMDEPQMKAYLYKIATNLINDYRRRIKRESRWFLNPRPREDAGRASTFSPDMERIFQELKPQERALLWLAYVEGSEHKEIAVTLGLKEKSVRVLLFRARQKLARILKRKGLGSEVLP